MMLLARRQGYVQLAEPQRFTHAWERDATLRLRAGDVTVLADYEEHGRLRGGTPEEATEQAYRGWLADYLDGKDTLLMARTEDQARELSRRARDDLIRYGLVAAGPAIRLAAGRAGQRRGPGHGPPQHPRHPGRRGRPRPRQPRRAPDHQHHRRPRRNRVEVRRLTGRDPATGQASWSAPFQVPAATWPPHATLAYATTQHAALGRTVDTAHVLVDGLGDRQGLYVAMSRGRDANHAYCITDYPRAADIRAGSRPAPELAARPAPGPRTRRPARKPSQPPDDGPAPASWTRCPCWPGSWPATAASCRRPRPCSGNCPAPTTSASSAGSGTTWPAAPRPPGSSRHCAAPCPPTSPSRPSTTRPAPGCGAPCAKPKPPGSTAAKSSAKPWQHGA